jgi:hydroxyethylthiazole kinase
MDIAARAARDLEQLRGRRPLVHHITNMVVMNETANVTLAVGALPVMAHAREEVGEMVGLAGALLLNIGTLTPELVDTMVVAGRAANERGVPVVLDPVGAGATRLRTDAAARLMDDVDVAVVRGNAGEVTAVAGEAAEVRGVESVGEYADIGDVAAALARERECVVSATGPFDVVTDGSRTVLVRNGDAMLGTITGTGCMSSTMVAAFCASGDEDALGATAAGLAAFGVAGEDAAARAKGPGSFHVELYDAIAALTPDELLERVDVVEAGG